MSHLAHYFHQLNTEISSLPLPDKFTFPFYYEPNPIAELAVEQLQAYLSTQKPLCEYFNVTTKENFVLENSSSNGKMFGVLVVQKPCGEIGYLSAFSGKLPNQEMTTGFVPPVYDILAENDFFPQEQTAINQINEQIKTLEKQPAHQTLITLLEHQEKAYQVLLEQHYADMATTRKQRKVKRAQTFSCVEEKNQLFAQLANESIIEKKALKTFKAYWQKKLNDIKHDIQKIDNKIDTLKKQRKKRSNALQKKIFKQYNFLNSSGKKKNLRDIFYDYDQQPPPAGAGECAAPKLLQFAFANQLTPICMAEFWWGASPKSEIRKHQHYYPACRGKCRPILHHMLADMRVDDDAIQVNLAENKTLEIIYQDNDILVVNKPADLLSVPGKMINDSVYTRVKALFPHATGSLIVHRLDMSTSGLLVLGLHERAHKNLQKQFIERQVSKRYVAILEGVLTAKKGEITLPLRVDLNDRPRQLVCEKHGKIALTHWETIEENNNRTRVYLYPRTGRTHQLRVHCSHILGLNTAIVGDDLYGKRDKRLCLHAQYLSFTHPITKKALTFEVAPDF